MVVDPKSHAVGDHPELSLYLLCPTMEKSNLWATSGLSRRQCGGARQQSCQGDVPQLTMPALRPKQDLTLAEVRPLSSDQHTYSPSNYHLKSPKGPFNHLYQGGYMKASLDPLKKKKKSKTSLCSEESCLLHHVLLKNLHCFVAKTEGPSPNYRS